MEMFVMFIKKLGLFLGNRSRSRDVKLLLLAAERRSVERVRYHHRLLDNSCGVPRNKGHICFGGQGKCLYQAHRRASRSASDRHLFRRHGTAVQTESSPSALRSEVAAQHQAETRVLIESEAWVGHSVVVQNDCSMKVTDSVWFDILYHCQCYKSLHCDSRGDPSEGSKGHRAVTKWCISMGKVIRRI